MYFFVFVCFSLAPININWKERNWVMHWKLDAISAPKLFADTTSKVLAKSAWKFTWKSDVVWRTEKNV